MGKGSTPRPMEIDREQFGNRFDAIFGKPKEAVKYVPEPIPPGRTVDRTLTEDKFKAMLEYYFDGGEVG